MVESDELLLKIKGRIALFMLTMEVNSYPLLSFTAADNL